MTVKEALKDYRQAALYAVGELDKIERTYKDEEAKRLKKGVLERLQEKKNAAAAVFAAEIEAGKKKAEEWARLDGDKITADAKLLDFDMEPGEFEELANRYKDNGTMSRLLYKYGETKNAQSLKENGTKGKYYPVELIPTRERKAAEYGRDAKVAQALMDRMTIEQGYMQGVGSPMVEAGYNNFMDGVLDSDE